VRKNREEREVRKNRACGRKKGKAQQLKRLSSTEMKKQEKMKENEEVRLAYGLVLVERSKDRAARREYEEKA
jgi:hypothetical protein